MIALAAPARREVPVPEPAYRPSVEVRDGPTGIRLVRTMLVALQPFAGIWLAAPTTPSGEALSYFLTTVDLARGWGAPLGLRAWPWVTFVQLSQRSPALADHVP